MPTPCSPEKNVSNLHHSPEKDIFITLLPGNDARCGTYFWYAALGYKNYVRKPTQPAFRFKLALELEGSPSMFTRLCLMLFTCH